jgi:addiction module HigA family antidote
MELERVPTHPGEILKEEFLSPLAMTQSHLAKALGTSFRAINELVNEKRGT